MAFFTGTSSKKLYETGRRYEMAGDTYRANADGSFTNERSRRTLVGSSRDPSVRWFESGSSGDGGSGSASARVVTGDPRTAGGSGSASARVVTGDPKTSGGSGSGSAVVVTGEGATSGGLLVPYPVGDSPPKPYEVGSDGFVVTRGPKAQRGRKFPFGGLDYEADPYWPTKQQIEDEYGEEFASPGWFALWAKTTADAVWNAQRAADWFLNPPPIDPADQYKPPRRGKHEGRATDFYTGGRF